MKGFDAAALAKQPGVRIGPTVGESLHGMMVVAAASVSPKDQEEDFQAALLKLARGLCWMAYHTRDSRKSAAGFPDLVLVRDGRVIFAELKTETGRLDAAQETWREVLEGVGGNVAYRLWRPSDWDRIVEILR